MKSDLEVAVESAKMLESLLVSNYSATGRGLHEKLSSVASQLPPGVVRDARFVATVRNKIVHEDTTRGLEDRSRFLAVVERLVQALSTHRDDPGSIVAPGCGRRQAMANHARRRSGSSVWKFLFTNGRHQSPVAMIGALGGFIFSAYTGSGFFGCLFLAGAGGLVGYWWNRVLGVGIIFLTVAAGLSVLYWLYSLFQT